MNLIEQDLTYEITGLCMKVHKILGHGFREIVYKDALEIEAKAAGIPFTRERQFTVNYKGIILPHNFFSDFVIDEKIIVEVKAAENALCEIGIAQTINYLKASGCKVGLLINFGRNSLEHRRVVL